MTQHFPVTESTLATAHVGNFVQQQYKLSTNATAKLLRTGMNHLYMIADGADRYVFRIYNHNWRSKTEVAEEVRLLRHLHDNSVSVSYPLPDTAGNYIQELNAPEGLRYGLLFSFAQGKKQPRFDAETAYNIGVMMGKLHSYTLDMQLQRTVYDANTLLVDSYKNTAAFFGTESEEMQFVKQLNTYLKQAYKSIDTTDIRHGVIHFDLWFDNMHITEDGMVTFFDFDFCGNGWLCMDIAYFLFQLYNTNLAGEDYMEKAERFMQGYESVTPIPKAEKEILPVVGLSVFMFYLGQQCLTFDTWSNVFLNEDHLKRFTGMLKRWMEYNKLQIAGS